MNVERLSTPLCCIAMVWACALAAGRYYSATPLCPCPTIGTIFDQLGCGLDHESLSFLTKV